MDISFIPNLDGNISICSNDSEFNNVSQSNTIPVHITNRPNHHNQIRNQNSKNNITIKRSNKLLQALNLPVVLNVNPRSVYNKISEFHTLVTEHQIDLICMSESWERANLTLNQIIQLEDHCVISNVHQQRGIGGRTAIIVNNKKRCSEFDTEPYQYPMGS